MPCYSLRRKDRLLLDQYQPTLRRHHAAIPPPYHVAMAGRHRPTLYFLNPGRSHVVTRGYPHQQHHHQQGRYVMHAPEQKQQQRHPRDDNMIWEESPANPRSPYLSAADYVFYIRRQLARESGFEGDPSTAEDRSISVELPKLSDLLRRLREDLRSCYNNFVDEFLSEPQEGVGWLLDLLKICQNRKSRKEGRMSMRNRERQQLMKRALADEYECLLCLRYSTRSSKAVDKMLNHRSGLTTIATSIMSDFTKSRMVALQLLTKTCELASVGYIKVLEAMSVLRLLYGESVRFKFLVAILNGNATTPVGFECVALNFLNSILKKCPRPSDRVRLQAELEEAGFHIALLEGKLQDKKIPKDDPVWTATQYWRDRYLDVNELLEERRTIITENTKLRDEVDMIRKAMKKLEMDKISLMQIERELKDKSEEMKLEMDRLHCSVSSKKNNKKQKPTSDDSDTSDTHATDSGRSSFITDDVLVTPPLDETDQAESEEIVIDIPTICPPPNFRLGEDNKKKNKKNSPASKIPLPKPSVETDLGIDWEYPVVPSVYVRPNSARSRSEERSKCRDMSIEDVKYVEATGFFYKPRSRKPLSELFPDTFKQQQQQQQKPRSRSTSKSDAPPTSLPPLNSNVTSSKHFPLPASYRSHFVLSGHSNCDRYSGQPPERENATPEVIVKKTSYKSKKSTEGSGSVRRDEDVTNGQSNGTISALVHKEIAEAVRQISGWL